MISIDSQDDDDYCGGDDLSDDDDDVAAEASSGAPLVCQMVNPSTPTKLVPTCCDDLRENFHPTSKAPEFYWNEREGQGLKGLVAKAFDKTLEDEFDPAELEFQIMMAEFCNELSERQLEKLEKVLIQVRNANTSMTIFKATRPPATTDDFKKQLLKGEKAILPNLPAPVVRSTEDGSHSYVSLIELIANEMAKGFEFDKDFMFESEVYDENFLTENKKNNRTMSQYPAAHKLFWRLKKAGPADENGMDTIYLYCLEWRDDFDPFGTKNNRNQVWIHTYTISPPAGDNSGRNTHFMSMSPKGADHTKIEIEMAKDLARLKEGVVMYCGKTKKFVRVKLGKLSINVDRPERTSIAQAGDHNGTYSTVFGHATQVDSKCKFNHLPSCEKCRDARIRPFVDNLFSGNSSKRTKTEECQQCSDWDIAHKFYFPPPKSYPTDCDKQEGAPKAPIGREVGLKKLSTIELSGPFLKEAIYFAHHNVKTQRPGGRWNQKFWGKGMARDYLRTCGLTNTYIDEVIDAAFSDSEPPLRPPWDEEDLFETFHYAPMHMLFLGITKAVHEILLKWMAVHELTATFGRQANAILCLIQKLRCSKYFNANPFSTSKWGTGPWVSENYVFLARAIKYFVTMPAILNPMKDHEGLKCVQRFMNITQVVLAAIMAGNVTPEHLDDLTKIFMSAMAEMDYLIEHLKKKKQERGESVAEEEPTEDPGQVPEKSKGGYIHLRGNSLGMLQVPHSHKVHGPARAYWEGGHCGERKIQGAKPMLTNGSKRATVDWTGISLQKLHRQEALVYLLDKVRVQKTKGREHQGLFMTYKNKTELTDALCSAEVVAGILSTDGKMYVLYRQKDAGLGKSGAVAAEVVMDDLNGENVAGLGWFAPIATIKEASSFKTMEEVVEIMDQAVLLLPRLMATTKDTRDASAVNSYYCIGSEWTERGSNGGFIQPAISPELFVDWCDSSSADEEMHQDNDVHRV